MIGWVARTIVALCKPKARLVVENLLLRQQLLILQRKCARPRLKNPDRLFWILAYRVFSGWRESLLVVKPETVLRWHRKGWSAYWRWRSNNGGKGGRRRIPQELRALIRRMASENQLWGQRRIQAELARLGFEVSARTVARYMRRPYGGVPSPGWRVFLERHAVDIWACDFFCVRTIYFRTLYVFFVVHHASREILRVRVTRHPTAEWASRQIVEACGWDHSPPRYLIHDRDSRYGAIFDFRIFGLGITQIRTPFRSPQANAIAERWVRSVRSECLDHTFIFNERHLHRVLNEYVAYFNNWRPHRSIGQRAPCAPAPSACGRNQKGTEVMGRPVLGGLHHVYNLAA